MTDSMAELFRKAETENTQLREKLASAERQVKGMEVAVAGWERKYLEKLDENIRLKEMVRWRETANELPIDGQLVLFEGNGDMFPCDFQKDYDEWEMEGIPPHWLPIPPIQEEK